MRPSVLSLTGLLLAAPVALAVLPSALAAPSTGARKAATPAVAPRVVVADIDSGINPYHVRFRGTNVTQAVLDEFGIGESQIVDLTRSGSVANAVKADFAGVERGKPYWFRGTNVIGISFDTAGTPIMGDAGDEHGTGTASSVLDANPEAVVVMVEGAGDADAEDWAFTHPAVDVVTTSYGLPGSPPVGLHLAGSYEGVVKNGKMHFGASDNSPALSPFDGTSGPWWSIAIAGFHEGSGEGRETLSGNVVDFLSDFTQTIPYCVDCRTGTREVSGTSFATPRSAGTASKVILQARKAAGHTGGITAGALVPAGATSKAVTTWTVRRALEEAASIPPMSGYKAQTAVLGDGASLPVLEDAAFVQAGWGLLNPKVVPAALEQLKGAAAVKDAATCDYNLAQFDARVAYWDSPAAAFSESAGGSEAYVRCG